MSQRRRDDLSVTPSESRPPNENQAKNRQTTVETKWKIVNRPPIECIRKLPFPFFYVRAYRQTQRQRSVSKPRDIFILNASHGLNKVDRAATIVLWLHTCSLRRSDLTIDVNRCAFVKARSRKRANKNSKGHHCTVESITSLVHWLHVCWGGEELPGVKIGVIWVVFTPAPNSAPAPAPRVKPPPVTNWPFVPSPVKASMDPSTPSPAAAVP